MPTQPYLVAGDLVKTLTEMAERKPKPFKTMTMYVEVGWHPQIGRYRYIAWVKCPYRVAGKA
jgi:hypothetical protein